MNQYTSWTQYIDNLEGVIIIGENTIQNLFENVAKVHNFSIQGSRLIMNDNISIDRNQYDESKTLSSTTFVRHLNNKVMVQYLQDRLTEYNASTKIRHRTVDYDKINQHILETFIEIISHFGETELKTLMMNAVWFGSTGGFNNWYDLYNKLIIQHLICRLKSSDYLEQFPINKTLFHVTIIPKLPLINKLNLTGSKIKSCTIINKDSVTVTQKTKFFPIVKDLWYSTPKQQLLEHTSFNFVNNNVSQNGFTFIEQHDCSFQRKDASGTFQEILIMMKLNQYSGELSIDCYEDEKSIRNYKIRIEHKTVDEVISEYINLNYTFESHLITPSTTFVNDFELWYGSTQTSLPFYYNTSIEKNEIISYIKNNYNIVQDTIVGIGIDDDDNTRNNSTIKMKTTEECCICFEPFSTEKKRVCIVPCGHSQLCKSCCSTVSKCPICNTTVDQIIQLF